MYCFSETYLGTMTMVKADIGPTSSGVQPGTAEPQGAEPYPVA